MYHHIVLPVVHMKMDAFASAKSPQLSLLLSKLFASIHYSLRLTTSFSTMSSKADQTSNITGDIPVAGAESVARAESEAAFSTSSSTMANQDIIAYHDGGCVPRILVYIPTTLDFPTIDQTNIVCFESHMLCRLAIPTSKFLVSVLNYIGCELVHLHLNAISALTGFSMLCECWLSIPPNTSLFCYFYSPTHYEHKAFNSGLMMRRNQREEYIKAPPEDGSTSTWVTFPNGQTSTPSTADCR
jgi:hypothetical protein